MCYNRIASRSMPLAIWVKTLKYGVMLRLVDVVSCDGDDDDR